MIVLDCADVQMRERVAPKCRAILDRSTVTGDCLAATGLRPHGLWTRR
jgi:hypothetical protein